MNKHMPDEVLIVMAGKFQMLADPTRLAILRTLMFDGERSVRQVVEATRSTQANLSKHLKLLAGAVLLARRKYGLNVLYRLDDPVVEKICHLVRGTITRKVEAHAGEDGQRSKRKGTGGKK